MRHRKGLTAAVAAGLAVVLFAPMSLAASKTTRKASKTTKKTGKAAATTAATTKPAATAAPATTTAPVPGGKAGGKAVVGIDAETNNWLPGIGQWGAAGVAVANSVYDRMMVNNADGKPVPSLLESATPSPDHKTWTLKARSGIKFHNGEAWDAAAIVANLEHVRTGSTTSPTMVNLNGCTVVDTMTAACTMKTAWVSFPAYLTGQTGAVAAPAQIKANDGRHLIGTGAFMCKGDCWVPNQQITLVKNPDYWRKGLPKLDSIEFRPIPDEDQRLAQLQSGQLQFLISVNFLTGRDLASLDKSGKVKLFTSEINGATNFDFVNLARPGPMQDVRVRRAWAYALDVDTLIQLRAPGATKANGAFPKGQLGYVDDTGYPQYDLDKAKALLDEYKKEKGVSRIEVTLQSTAVPDNQQLISVMKQMLDKAGFTINLGPGLEQAAYIGQVFTGNYEVMTWNYFAFPDPDLYRPFLHSEGCGGPVVCPRSIGGQVLNWGRLSNTIIDSSFDQIRANSDPAVRKRAAEAVNRELGENAFILWRWRNRFHFAECAKCGGTADPVTVDGEKLPAQSGGNGFVAAPWLTVG